MTLTFAHHPAIPTAEELRAAVLADPCFGTRFTDHMVTAVWTPDVGWHDAGVSGSALRAGDLRGTQGVPPR